MPQQPQPPAYDQQAYAQQQQAYASSSLSRRRMTSRPMPSSSRPMPSSSRPMPSSSRRRMTSRPMPSSSSHQQDQQQPQYYDQSRLRPAARLLRPVAPTASSRLRSRAISSPTPTDNQVSLGSSRGQATPSTGRRARPATAARSSRSWPASRCSPGASPSPSAVLCCYGPMIYSATSRTSRSART